MKLNLSKLLKYGCLVLLLISIGISFTLLKYWEDARLAEIEKRGGLYVHFLEPAIRKEVRQLNKVAFDFYSANNNGNVTIPIIDSYVNALLKYNKFLAEIQDEISIYPWRRFRNPDVWRTLEIISNARVYSGISELNLKWLKRFEIENELRVESYKCRKVYGNDNNDKPESVEALKETWLQFYNLNEPGPNSWYLEKYVSISVEAEVGSAVDKVLESQFEIPGGEVRDLMDTIWRDIQPFYKQLHIYIRRRLGKFFKDGSLRFEFVCLFFALSYPSTGVL
jgi:hypothetical protein